MALKNREIWENGVLVRTETFQMADTFDNSLTLLDRARQALATNATYLAQPAIPASPTLVQLTAAVRVIRAQVDALTRQSTGSIRLDLSQLDDITDS